MELPQLRAALHLLYFGASSGERHAADVWLRGFTSSSQDRAWRVLAALLADGAAAEHERFFAAQQLRLSCQRQDGVLAPDSLAALARLLAGQLAAAAAAGCRHTVNQLAAALATLAARSPSWPEREVLPRTLHLAREALHGAPGADGERQQWALLRLLAALAEAAGARGVGMRPERRQALLAALCASCLPLEAAQQALGPGAAGGGSLRAQAAALQLVQAWCGLGCPPAGSEACLGLWRHLHALVLHPDLGGAAAEALAALHAACLADSGGGGGTRPERGPGGSPPSGCEAPDQHTRLRQLLLELLPGFGSALQQALARSEHPSQRARLLFAALALLGAAARSADAHAAGCLPGADAAAAAAAQLAAEVALAALQQPQAEVVLAALQCWDEQLERWGGGGGGGRPGGGQPAVAVGACAPPQRRDLLQRLCSALLQRMALPEGLPQHACTADARNLPDAVSKLRRELSDTFRSAADALGAEEVRRQLLQLAAQAAAAGARLQQECCLYALNLVWGRQQAQQPREHAAAKTAAAAAAAAAALLPAAPKLAGTALTLLGGMAEQLVLLVPGDGALVPRGTAGQAGQLQDGALLEALLDRLLLLLRLPADPKLSRNAATCCHRLTGCRALAAALAARHARWADALCCCFADAGGMRQPPGAGGDLTTPQFLLASICQLAAAAAARGAGGGDGPALLQRLLSQPAAAARDALAAAAAAAPGSEAQREQLGCAAVQVETIAVALEAAAGERGSDGSTGSGGPLTAHLPSLLAGTASALQAAAAAAAACDAPATPRGPPPPRQPLVRAVCRVAAATSGTPAAAEGLALLRPLLASPPHPSLLAALSQLVAGGSSSRDARQELEAAVGLSLRAAAAAHSADPDWQPALLALGTGCLQRLPAAAAAPATLDALLATAGHGMQSYHRPTCEAMLRFAEALCCVGCQPLRSHPAGGSSPDGKASEPPWPDAVAEAAAAARQLRQRLDAGLGWQLVQGLLLAGAGAMPPYMLALLADGLHRTWLAVGTDRFGAWLRDAVQRAPEGEAPWRRWKPAAQAAALGELLSPLCAADARRFKRLLKVFCGGKKKGQHVEQPARGG